MKETKMKNIQLIIFDLDGTLYNLEDVAGINYEMQVDFYSSYFRQKKEDVVNIFNKNNIFPVINSKSRSATEFFLSQGISIDEWSRYREKIFNVKYINASKSVDFEVLERFREVAPLVLLSSNSYKNILIILNHIAIDANIFDEIVCSDHGNAGGNFKKSIEMKNIAIRRNILCDNIVSIGDRYETDVEPMLQLNGTGILVNGPKDLEKVLCTIC